MQRELQFLPEQNTEFVFVVVSENTMMEAAIGGAVLVLIVIGFLVWRRSS